MKSLPPILAALAVSAAHAALPEFTYRGVLQSDGSEIRANISCASPCPVDWDGDGDLDLLMGEFGENVYPAAATIRLFVNTAATPDMEPVLTGGATLSAGGSEIQLSAG